MQQNDNQQSNILKEDTQQNDFHKKGSSQNGIQKNDIVKHQTQHNDYWQNGLLAE